MTRRRPRRPPSRPSRNGKKASEATTEPATSRPACSALMTAMRAESTRLIWPAPTPASCRRRQNTMALDLTNLATFQANSRSRHLRLGGLPLGDHASARRSDGHGVAASCTSRPPSTRFEVAARCGACPAASLEQAHVLLGGEHAQRLGLKRGRDDHLDELRSPISCARSRVQRAVEGDDAAEGRRRVGRVGLACRPRSGVAPTATPQGLACLTMTQAGCVEALDAFPARHRCRRCCCRRAPCPAAARSGERGRRTGRMSR